MDSLRWILLGIGIVLVAAIYWTGRRRARARDETLFERARRGDPQDVDASDAPKFDADASSPANAEPHEARASEPDLEVASFDPQNFGDELSDLGRLLDGEREPAGGPVEPTSGARRSSRSAAGRTEKPDEPVPDASPEPAPQPPSPEERIEVLYVVAPKGEQLVGSRLSELFDRHGLTHGEFGIFHAGDAEGRTVFSVANLVEPGTFDPATMDTLSTPGLALFARLPGPQSAETAFDRMLTMARTLAGELDAHVLDRDHSTLTRQTEQHLRDQLREFDHRHDSS